MSLVIACGNQRFTVTGDEALIGRDTACAIALPDDSRLAARHAALRMVGGRWLIEARADSMLQVGSNPPSRLGWLNDGDVIRLTTNGPELIFNPPNQPAVGVARPESSKGVASDDVPPRPSMTQGVPPNSGRSTNPVSDELATAEAPLPKLSRGPQPPPAREPSSVLNDWKKPIAISTAIIVVVGLLWGLVSKFFFSANDPNANISSTSPKNPEPEPIVSEPANTTKPKLISSAATVAVTDSVYAVLVASEDRQQVYQVGTAWAVSPQQLVTSGAVVQAIESLRSNLDVVMVRHPATKSDFFVSERVHPKFSELTTNATQLQTKLVELDRQLAKTTDAGEKQKLEQQLQELDLQLVALFRETMYFDIGVLEVRDRLPHFLPRSDKPVAKGQRLRLIGVPFPVDEQLLNPDRPPQHQELSGQFLATLPAIEAAASPIIFNVALKDLQGHQWSGAPVLNAAGQVGAVFSRLAPPDIKGPPDPNQLRPHATDIRALRDLIP